MRVVFSVVATFALIGCVQDDPRPTTEGSILTILHTNDIHSRIQPINAFNSTCSVEDDEAGECFGGTARLSTAITKERGIDPDLLFVSGGDEFQGSLIYTTYKGSVAARAMNSLGYDGMTAGNHEFDDGPEALGSFIETVNFPVLLTNADVSAEPLLADILLPVTIVEKRGYRIGLLGLTPEDTGELSSAGENIKFTDAVAALNSQITALTADGIDRIVVMSHSGINRDLELAAAVPGIDVIVGGHTNTFLANTDDAEGPYPTMVDGPAGQVAIVHTSGYGKYLGKISVTFDDDGRLLSATGDPILLDASVTPNPDMKAWVEAIAAPVEELKSKYVGEASATIDGSEKTCRVSECSMGTLLTDAMLERTRDQGIDVAFMNGGGMRSSIDAGEITMGEVLGVVPFQNTVATFKIKGADLLAALEAGVSQVEDESGRFPQVAGMRFEWTRTKPANSRILKVEVEKNGSWEPLDTEAVYGVVTNDYLRQGGDGYAMFNNDAINPYDYGPGLEMVLADYIGALNAPYEPKTPGRIVEK